METVEKSVIYSLNMFWLDYERNWCTGLKERFVLVLHCVQKKETNMFL